MDLIFQTSRKNIPGTNALAFLPEHQEQSEISLSVCPQQVFSDKSIKFKSMASSLRCSHGQVLLDKPDKTYQELTHQLFLQEHREQSKISLIVCPQQVFPDKSIKFKSMGSSLRCSYGCVLLDKPDKTYREQTHQLFVRASRTKRIMLDCLSIASFFRQVYKI